jgi:hypothetical protein
MALPIEVVAAVLVLGGLALCFRGYGLFRVFLPAAGFVVFAMLGAELARPYAHGDGLTVVGAALIGGILGAGLLMAAFLYGLFLFGAASGWYAGAVLAPMFGAQPGGVALVTAVIGGIVAVLAQRPLVALATAVWGALFAFAGVQVWMGKLPVDRLAEPGIVPALVQRADAPALAILLLALAGVALQLKPGRAVAVS